MTSNIVLSSSISMPARSSDEWEQKRPIITQLYRDEAKTLDAVRMTLASQHDFRPTKAMLKKRITKWALDRNHKQSEMIAALRLAFQREAEGKKTVFFIRERLITFDEVKRYFQRKGVKDLKSLVVDTDAVASPAMIDCCTPGPDVAAVETASTDVEMLAENQYSDPDNDYEVSHLAKDVPVIVVAGPIRVEPVRSSVPAMRQLDQLLYVSRIYYDGVFGNQALRIQKSNLRLVSMAKFCAKMTWGRSLLARREYAKAFEYFNRGFDDIHRFFKRPAVLFLPYLLGIISDWRDVREQEVLSSLLNLISKMPQTHNPPHGRVQQSVVLLRQMSISDRIECSQRALQSIKNCRRIKSEAAASNVSDSPSFTLRFAVGQVISERTEDINLGLNSGEKHSIFISVSIRLYSARNSASHERVPEGILEAANNKPTFNHFHMHVSDYVALIADFASCYPLFYTI